MFYRYSSNRHSEFMKNLQKGVDTSLYDMFNRTEPARFNFYETITQND